MLVRPLAVKGLLRHCTPIRLYRISGLHASRFGFIGYTWFDWLSDGEFVDNGGDLSPPTMRAWILEGPGELRLVQKPTPRPGPAEVLVRIDAVAVCATDLEVIWEGSPALIEGGLPFEKQFTPGHEYMGTIVAVGPDVSEFRVGERVSVEIHAGCGRCRRCREGMYTSCLNYGANHVGNNRGHRANGFTTDGGFAQYAVNHINTLVRVPDEMSDEEAALVVTAGTSMYGFIEMGGVLAGASVAVIGPGPIGLLAVGIAKSLGGGPVILSGTRPERLAIGAKLGADRVVNATQSDPVAAIQELCPGGVDFVVDCAGTEESINQAIRIVNRGGKICLAAFPHKPVSVALGDAVRNNVYIFGIRGEGRSAVSRSMALMAARRFDATLIHTHTFPMDQLPDAIRHARERLDGAIKVIVRPQH